MAAEVGAEAPGSLQSSASTEKHVPTGKRKRDGNDGQAASLGEVSRDAALHAFLRDAVEVLKDYDSFPSILGAQIKSHASNAPSPKRAKPNSSSLEPAIPTIAAQVSSHAYATLQEFQQDVDVAKKEVLKDSEGTARSSREGMVLRFAKEMEHIIVAESLHDKQGILAGNQSIRTDDKLALTNGHRSPQPASAQRRSVLTLFGSGGSRDVPRQLFANFKYPTSGVDGINGTVGTNINEAALPNGMSTTTIIPVHSSNDTARQSQNNRPRTLGQSYSRPKYPFLAPKITSTVSHGHVVDWADPSAPPSAPARTTKDSYYNQPLTTGSWLAHCGRLSNSSLRQDRIRSAVSRPEDATASRGSGARGARQKQASLFKSVYSSFAPNHSNEAAVVPQHMKNKVWWDRIGHQAYQALVTPSSSLALEQRINSLNASMDDDGLLASEEEEFVEAVRTFQPDAEAQSPDEEPREVEELLKEVSDFIETLHVHQQARIASTNTFAKGSTGQDKELGTPSTPSSAEIEMHEMLKSQLSLLVSQLPPYAVARLNGDKLEALQVSTKIPMEIADHRGTLDEPVKPATYNSTSTAPPRPVGVHSTVPARITSYQTTGATPPARTSYTAPRSATATASYSQYGPKPVTSQYGSYTAQPASRTGGSHAQYVSQTSPAQYANGYRAPVQNGYSTYSSNYNAAQSTPIAGRSAQVAQRAPQNSYQQRVPPTPVSNSYSTAAVGRASSPQKPTTLNRTAYPTNQAQPSAPAAAATYYNRPGSSNAMQQGTPGTIGGMITMTAEEQEIMDRRRKAQNAQIEAQQQQMQQIGGGAFRQGSGTPGSQGTNGLGTPGPAAVNAIDGF